MKQKDLKKLDAIIFDFDGVIFNTEPLWFKAAIKTLKKLNLPINKKITYKRTIGVHSDIVFETLINKKLNFSTLNKINKVFKKELHKIFNKKLKPFSYLKNFIKNNKAELLIVSNSEYTFIEKLLKKADLKKYFKTKNIISCSLKIKPKPEPDGYNLAIKKLNLKKSNILVIEDSENGITAAKKAGIKNIFRFTNNNYNLSDKIKHKNIRNIKSYRELIK